MQQNDYPTEERMIIRSQFTTEERSTKIQTKQILVGKSEQTTGILKEILQTMPLPLPGKPIRHSFTL
jgi:hypothetical protein